MVTGRLTVMLSQKEDLMSITGQLDTQLRATNVAKLDMRRGFVRTPPAFKLLLEVEATPLDLRHNRTEWDALHKLEDYRMITILKFLMNFGSIATFHLRKNV